ncbi:YkoP family protein [Anaerobacillus sp. MEB173]|uniref:YkoP family protein n=1 Tax=Anaerobacillus sp. MEB173 TaxID=3383345 RepID=UPI003F8E56C3
MRSILFNIWNFIDPFYINLYGITHLSDGKKEKNKNIFRVRLTKYKGRDVVLSDGCSIKKNDILIKIHLYNTQLIKDMLTIQSDVKKALLIYKMVEESLPSLAAYIKEHEKYEEIKGIVGITMINRGHARLGFESISIKSRIYRWFKAARLSPISFLFSTEPSSYKKKKHAPNYLFMSKEKLLQKYLQAQ